MRIRTANNNRRRLANRARRDAAIRRWLDRSAAIVSASLFPESRPWFRFDLARPGSDHSVVCYGGALGGGKSDTFRMMRERLERDPIAVPEAQVFWNDLAMFGTAAAFIDSDGSPIRNLTREEFFETYPAADDAGV